ncbi:hypothetical protein [Nocardia sp. NPDC058114]|uniref:hypothetical protein n=1 Tax=Nocardia sp. NPDC058114 TaxID=3346346 RepID=UPI0036DCDC71
MRWPVCDRHRRDGAHTDWPAIGDARTVDRQYCTQAELHSHIRRQLDNIVAQAISLSDTAIITDAESEAVLRQLRRWAIAAQEVLDYRCADNDNGVEVGTVYRAKGGPGTMSGWGSSGADGCRRRGGLSVAGRRIRGWGVHFCRMCGHRTR